MASTRTTITIDATEFGRFLEHMAEFSEIAAADDDATTYTRAFSTGAAQAYRSTLETLTRMVEEPTDSPFVVLA